MATYYTGANGSLFVGGTQVAKVRNWSITGSVETLNVTTTGDTAQKFIYGRQNYTGSCTALYYENDSEALEMASMLQNIIRTTATTPTATQTLRLKLADDRVIEAAVLFTQADIAVTTGDLVSVNLSFQVNGGLTTATMGSA
jgi:hypothetical protein